MVTRLTMKVLKLVVISILYSIGLTHSSALALQDVLLNSTLIRGNLALPGQGIVFTCITRNTTILEWQSDEYIGSGGGDIQIYSVGSRDIVNSSTIPSTYATRVSVTVENGITVIVSQLFITASEQYPTSSVTCRIDGQGPRTTISFNTTAMALQEVILNSTLNCGNFAFPGQRVVFTCVTRNGTILEWQSDDYISQDGGDIQIYSVGSRNNVTSFSNQNTYATRVSVTVENGITVIVSQLFITASEQFPTSSVTCRIDGQGPRKTISFNTTAMALKEITLNSTLIQGDLTFRQQRVLFTCTTRNTTILEWQSDEYIGSGGGDIQIYSVGSRDIVNSSTIPSTYATRVSVTVENGITVIVSQLFITASEQFPTSSVTCRIDGQGPKKTISFNTTSEDPPLPKLNSTLHEGVSACPGDSHQFDCIATYSYNIGWTSEEYIGGLIQINNSFPNGTPLQALGNMDTYAVLKSVRLENGELQLTSSLNIVVSPSIADQNHTVTCLNVDLGTQQSITFQIAEVCDGKSTTTSTYMAGETVSDNQGSQGRPQEMPDTTTSMLRTTLISVTCVLIVISVLTFIIGFVLGHYFRWRKSAKNDHNKSSINRTNDSEEDLELRENPAYISVVHNNDSEVEYAND